MWYPSAWCLVLLVRLPLGRRPKNILEIDSVVVRRVVDGRISEMWDIPAVNTGRVRNLLIREIVT